MILYNGLSGFINKDYPLLDKFSLGADYSIINNFNLRGSMVRYINESVQEFNLGLGLTLDKITFADQYYMMRLDYNYTLSIFSI